jgi:predicted esterase
MEELDDIEYYFLIYNKGSKEIPIIIFYPKKKECSNCIIYSFGKGGDIGKFIWEYQNIAELTECYAVGYEYPGYGYCKDSRTEENDFFEHIELAYKFVEEELPTIVNKHLLTKSQKSKKESQKECSNECKKECNNECKKEIKIENIFLYGYSLGTAISIDFLSRTNKKKIKGLILQAPPLSILRTFRYIDDDKTFYFDMFNTIDKIDKIGKLPTLILNGDKDKLVTLDDLNTFISKFQYKEYLDDIIIFQDIDHNNIPNTRFIYIKKFIDNVCKGEFTDEKRKDNKNIKYIFVKEPEKPKKPEKKPPSVTKKKNVESKYKF